MDERGTASKVATKYYPHIDGLRAVAVLSVILNHLSIRLFSGGFVGVDVFFVISGFLVTNIIVKELKSTGTFSFINFYARRIRRIFPALLFTLFISFLCAIYFLNLAKFIAFGGSLLAAAFYTSNIYFNSQSGYFDIFSQSNPLLHTWSLGVEEQFYIFWPMLLLASYKLLKNKTIFFVVLIFIASLTLNLFYQNKSLVPLYYLSQYRAFEFCIGAALVWLIKYKPVNNILFEILCLLGLILIITPILFFNSTTLFPSYNALIPAIGAAFVIYAGSARRFGYLLSNKYSRYVGLISYSLYLVHWPLITFAKSFNQDIGNAFNISVLAKCVVVVLAFIIASFMYYFVETPFRKNIPNASRSQLKLIGNWLAISSIVGALGCTAYFSHGWIWRANSPDVVASIGNLSKYHEENWGGAGFKDAYIHKGATSYPNLVIMGDSHAEMLDAGIVSEIAKSNDLTVYTVTGGGDGKYESSLLLPGITRLSSNQSSFDNSDKLAPIDATQALDQSPNSTLIYSAAYSFQINRSGFLGTHKSLGINTNNEDKYDEYSPIIKALEDLRVDLAGRNMILIGEVPGASFDVMNCATQLKWFKNQSCRLRDPINRNQAALNVNRVLSEYAKKHANVYFINPYDVFCIKQFCSNVDNHGTPYYSDGSHLSKTGSNYFIGTIKNKLISIIDKSGDRKRTP